MKKIICISYLIRVYYPQYTEFFFFLDVIYLFMRETERQRHRQREKQAPYREPDVELDPKTPGSHPEPKADAQL